MIKWLTKIFKRSSNPEQHFIDYFSPPSAAGVRVDEESALRVSAVLACVKVLSETVASLPLIVYRRLPDGGKERASQHYLYLPLHDQPNPLMTKYTFWETLTHHVLLWGNAYAEIEYNARGEPIAFWPLSPTRVAVIGNTRRIQYEISLDNGGIKTLPSSYILHIPGLGFDGIVGYSPIALMREAVGLALATEEFGAKFFSSGTHLGGYLETDRALSDTAYERLKRDVKSGQGLENAHRLQILEEGLKYSKVTIPPEDAQYILTRKMQIAEIARIYRVPLHLVGETDKAATFASVEQFQIQFIVHTVRPWLVRLEQILNTKLFLPTERREYFCEFLIDGLLRGDIASRYNAYAIGRQHGWLSADDVRRMENMNPLPDGQGKHYLIPMNMQVVSAAIRPDEPVEKNNREKRSKRNRLPRNKLRKLYLPLFRDAIGRMLKREEADIMRKVRKTDDLQRLSIWLTDFYLKHEDYIRKQIRPAFQSLAEAVYNEALDEAADYFAAISDTGVRAEGSFNDDIKDKLGIYIEAPGEVGRSDEVLPDEIKSRLERYLTLFVKRHTGESVSDLRKVINRTDNIERIERNMQSEFDRWQEPTASRLTNQTQNETVRATCAIAVMAWAAIGIRRIKWVTVGENCDFCNALDGRVVGVDEGFVGGEGVSAKGKLLAPSELIFVPPLHSGCDCDIMIA